MPRSNSNNTAAFFALTFLFTYVLQLPGVLAIKGLLPGARADYLPLAMLGIFGPLVAASFLSWREGGLRQLFAGLFAFRVPLRYMLMALFLPGFLLSAILWMMRDSAWYFLPDGSRLVAALVISVAEETGWRGYALPRLTAKYGAFLGSCILGVLWALWHIPMLIAADFPPSLALPALLYFLGGSLFFTYLVQKTRGSLFIAVLAHIGVHLNNSNLALPADTLPFLVQTVVFAALGFVSMRRAAFELPGKATLLPATGGSGYPGSSNAQRQTLSS